MEFCLVIDNCRSLTPISIRIPLCVPVLGVFSYYERDTHVGLLSVHRNLSFHTPEIPYVYDSMFAGRLESASLKCLHNLKTIYFVSSRRRQASFLRLEMATSMLRYWFWAGNLFCFDAGGLELAKVSIQTNSFPISTQKNQIRTFAQIVYTSQFSTAKANPCIMTVPTFCLHSISYIFSKANEIIRYTLLAGHVKQTYLAISHRPSIFSPCLHTGLRWGKKIQDWC